MSFLKNDAEIFAGGFRKVGIFEQQIGEPQDRSQRIIYFVGDAGDKLADSRHFFGVNKFAAEFGGVGDVRHDHDDAVDIVLLVAHGTEVDGELAGVAVSCA